MVITTTAVAFLSLSIGLAFCGWRFLKALRRTNNSNDKTDSKIGFLLTLFFIGFAIQTGIILGLGTHSSHTLLRGEYSFGFLARDVYKKRNWC